MYRVTHPLADWVGLTLIWDVSRLVGRYCSYLLPKQAGGTPQIKVNPSEVRQEMCHPVHVLGNGCFNFVQSLMKVELLKVYIILSLGRKDVEDVSKITFSSPILFENKAFFQ